MFGERFTVGLPHSKPKTEAPGASVLDGDVSKEEREQTVKDLAENTITGSVTVQVENKPKAPPKK